MIGDLIQYVGGILAADTTLATIFSGNGNPNGVDIVFPGRREVAVYPRITLNGDDGEEMSFGDSGTQGPLFVMGRVRVEIITRQSTACPDAVTTLYAIKNRVQALLLGNKALGLVSPLGAVLTNGWRCSVWHQVNPTRFLPNDDQTIVRYLITFEAQVVQQA